MKPEEFTHYVDSQLRQGIPRNSLIVSLQAGGWSKEQIDNAFAVHDKRVRTDLLPTHKHFYTASEVVLWVALFLVVMLTILFYIGGE
jgi:hypothetical protein